MNCLRVVIILYSTVLYKSLFFSLFFFVKLSKLGLRLSVFWFLISVSFAFLFSVLRFESDAT